ncbi:MAG: hypothetical protein GY870_09415 [archaeon]|nr:hypothetical protein [archaeon]
MTIEEGKKCMEEKDFEGAVANFKSAEAAGEKKASKLIVKALEEWGETVNKLGDQLLKRKSYKEAIIYYKQSIEIMEEAGNNKKVANYQGEFSKASEKLAEEINQKGDKAYKEKKYEESIKIYLESIQLMIEAGNEKKSNIFKKELKNALNKRATQLTEEAEKFAKEGNLEQAIDRIQKAIVNAQQTDDEKIIANFNKVSYNIYEIVADLTNSKGDKAFKDKNWEQAVPLYKKSVELISKANNKKKLTNYQKELVKAFQESAQEINNSADKAFKEGNYVSAIEIYQQSIEAAKLGENEKLIAGFEKELEKCFESYAQKINNEGDNFLKEKRFEEAVNQYKKSVELAQNSNKQKLLKNFTNELDKAYEKWAEEINTEGDNLFKNKDFENAVDKYKKSILIIDNTSNKKQGIKFEKELQAAYIKWAEGINTEGDNLYKMDKFEDAYSIYSKSVELAELAKNEKLVKKFRKERDKALKKMQ